MDMRPVRNHNLDAGWGSRAAPICGQTNAGRIEAPPLPDARAAAAADR